MLHIMVGLEVAAGLETHQSHAHLVKLFNLSHFFRSNLNLFATNRIKRSHFLSVKSFTGLIANESLRRPQLLIILSIHFLDAWLFRWYDRAKER